jgi:hypothetical protein
MIINVYNVHNKSLQETLVTYNSNLIRLIYRDNLMPFEVINYGKQNDKAGDVIEAFVIPTNINLLAPHLDSGKAALEEAGDGLASILTEYGCVDGKSLVTKSFKLQKCKSISYLIHSVITLSDKNTAGL